MKHPKLVYGFITVLGITFLAITFSILPLVEYLSWLLHAPYFVSYCLFGGGTGLVTIGICGFGRQHFKDYRQLFTLYAIPLIPLSILAMYVIILILTSPLEIGF